MKRRATRIVASVSLAVFQSGCGNADSQTNMVAAKAASKTAGAPVASGAGFGAGGRDHPYEAVRSAVIEAPFGPVRITELAVRNPAHVDSGMLAVTYLQRSSGELTALRDFPDAVKSGSSGRLGSWAIDNRFSSFPVIVTEGGGTWQGRTCLWTTITELRPSGPVELTTFQQSFSTDGLPDGKPVDVAGEIVSIERDRAFTVRFIGTRAFDAVYKRQGDRYVLQGGDDRALHGC